ncbi:MAG: hypothetical protein HOV68_30965 [Streptomycetaceae bacterium]|nr:hypothetical protein [Streptomycetaceae bacterium]
MDTEQRIRDIMRTDDNAEIWGMLGDGLRRLTGNSELTAHLPAEPSGAVPLNTKMLKGYAAGLLLLNHDYRGIDLGAVAVDAMPPEADERSLAHGTDRGEAEHARLTFNTFWTISPFEMAYSATMRQGAAGRKLTGGVVSPAHTAIHEGTHPLVEQTAGPDWTEAGVLRHHRESLVEGIERVSGKPWEQAVLDEIGVYATTDDSLRRGRGDAPANRFAELPSEALVLLYVNGSGDAGTVAPYVHGRLMEACGRDRSTWEPQQVPVSARLTGIIGAPATRQVFFTSFQGNSAEAVVEAEDTALVRHLNEALAQPEPHAAAQSGRNPWLGLTPPPNTKSAAPPAQTAQPSIANIAFPLSPVASLARNVQRATREINAGHAAPPTAAPHVNTHQNKNLNKADRSR